MLLECSHDPLPVLFALPNATTTINHSSGHQQLVTPLGHAPDTQAGLRCITGINHYAFAQPSLVYKHLGRRALPK